ncbi:hypothetical protein M501DRAFT_986900 [Patellaria atrata CBS 101060]|uniref:Uncharacterized protein n=1 Tax=Patellaria atrata CBS 101060 TaxID=1346257 RepID=A0A9P4VR23_9PEZI|nr:hypothetical protein M501DRAFT_986900 [Patellaria atrata CBS 101060]
MDNLTLDSTLQDNLLISGQGVHLSLLLRGLPPYSIIINMPCDEIGHNHLGLKHGILVVRSCEKYCGYCDGGENGDEEFLSPQHLTYHAKPVSFGNDLPPYEDFFGEQFTTPSKIKSTSTSITQSAQSTSAMQAGDSGAIPTPIQRIFSANTSLSHPVTPDATLGKTARRNEFSFSNPFQQMISRPQKSLRNGDGNLSDDEEHRVRQVLDLSPDPTPRPETLEAN